MTATLPYNPRVLAAPDLLDVPGDVAQLLADSRWHGAWCVAMDGLERRAASELQRAASPQGGSVWGWTGKDVSDVRLCVRADRVGKMLDRLEGRGEEAAGVQRAVRATLEAWERRRWTLRCGGRELEVGRRTLVMGIVNVTPDSFSDGGRFVAPLAAIEHGRQLVEGGADILDIGGESTRPGAAEVDAEAECRRVLPVIEVLAAEVGAPISIDTSKAAVARRALDAGATMLNDVTALRGDPDMARVAADGGVPVVLMHMKGSPRTMQKAPHYDDLMAEIIGHLRGSMAIAAEAGVAEEQIVVDPGIGFGKTVEHNLDALRQLRQLRSLGCPILLGTSRKSFIGAITGAPVAERAFGTAATVALGIQRGAHIVRVHDVAAMRQVVQMADAMLGRGA